MIIVGYPGIGKTTICKNNWQYIDLESHFEEGVEKPKDWESIYANIALKLSRDGYIVFTSCHDKIVTEILESDEQISFITPSYSLKDEWIEKLRKRMIESSDEELDKNYKAYLRVKRYYNEDVIKRQVIPRLPVPFERYKSNKIFIIIINDMCYNLEEIVNELLSHINKS